MFLKLMRLVAPFAAIARELSTIRELYELDLGSRKPPVYRFTEKPKRSDTEVTYAGEEPKRKSALERAKELFDKVGEDDDES